ncbi:MAG: thiol peroxidase [Acidobacteria bacterium]|nr:thiol peroxidase [Acidobacteriota bacterium]
MADSRQVTMKGNPLPLEGKDVQVGQTAPDFSLTGIDMKTVTLGDTSGVRIFSIVPSLDTPVCDAQTRRFNEAAAELGNVTIYTVSRDLPFAQKRWCGAAGVDKVVTLSDYKDGNFGLAWGVMIEPLKIFARAVYVVDADNKVTYGQLVPEVAEHPDYDAALAAAKAASA